MVDTPIRALLEPSLEARALPTDEYAWHRALVCDARLRPAPARVEVVSDSPLV
ncbi:MAG TPA: hypothetical protein VMZ73_00820 [Acidimicrobiales bacterium]|nr:hypothetical protein [Acidimicrobiales bacterium]